MAVINTTGEQPSPLSKLVFKQPPHLSSSEIKKDTLDLVGVVMSSTNTSSLLEKSQALVSLLVSWQEKPFFLEKKLCRKAHAMDLVKGLDYLWPNCYN